MAGLERYLLRTERLQFSVRRHWAALASAGATLVGFWLLGLLGLGLFHDVDLLKLVFVFFLIFSLGWFGWIVADWYVERFVVTDRRVLLISGLLTRKVAVMPLVKVTDLTYEQTITGRALDYGSFVIESAGQHQALSRIDYLPDPNQHYLQVSQLLFGTNADSDPDDYPDRRDTAPVPHVRPGDGT